ncbi:hypothetical protein ABZZ17_38230 [Streptomyces sp. NPDC006512]|uniref:hypothetical protein n=1 Tax=Streptomyces sp. NPDC006512 TaxID=3154307 RepID=UPI0033A720F8
MAISRARKALFTGLVGASATLVGFATFDVAYAGPQAPFGAAANGEMPALVEDFGYPNAAKIQAEREIVLKRGDGHITLVNCSAGTPDILVKSRTGNREFCFDVNAPKGYVTLELPASFGIWTQAYPVKATITAGGTQTVIEAPANEYKPIGEGTVNGATSVLVELRVSG